MIIFHNLQKQILVIWEKSLIIMVFKKYTMIIFKEKHDFFMISFHIFPVYFGKLCRSVTDYLYLSRLYADKLEANV